MIRGRKWVEMIRNVRDEDVCCHLLRQTERHRKTQAVTKRLRDGDEIHGICTLLPVGADKLGHW